MRRDRGCDSARLRPCHARGKATARVAIARVAVGDRTARVEQGAQTATTTRRPAAARPARLRWSRAGGNARAGSASSSGRRGRLWRGQLGRIAAWSAVRRSLRRAFVGKLLEMKELIRQAFGHRHARRRGRRRSRVVRCSSQRRSRHRASTCGASAMRAPSHGRGDRYRADPRRSLSRLRRRWRLHCRGRLGCWFDFGWRWLRRRAAGAWCTGGTRFEYSDERRLHLLHLRSELRGEITLHLAHQLSSQSFAHLSCQLSHTQLSGCDSVRLPDRICMIFDSCIRVT